MITIIYFTVALNVTKVCFSIQLVYSMMSISNSMKNRYLHMRHQSKTLQDTARHCIYSKYWNIQDSLRIFDEFDTICILGLRAAKKYPK